MTKDEGRMTKDERLFDKVHDSEPTRARMIGRVIVGLNVKVGIREWRAGAVNDPHVPGRRRIECANRFEDERIARAAIGLAARKLFFDDGRNVGTGGDAHAHALLRLTTATHRAFDLRAARVRATPHGTIRVGDYRYGGRCGG